MEINQWVIKTSDETKVATGKRPYGTMVLIESLPLNKYRVLTYGKKMRAMEAIRNYTSLSIEYEIGDLIPVPITINI